MPLPVSIRLNSLLVHADRALNIWGTVEEITDSYYRIKPVLSLPSRGPWLHRHNNKIVFYADSVEPHSDTTTKKALVSLQGNSYFVWDVIAFLGSVYLAGDDEELRMEVKTRIREYQELLLHLTNEPWRPSHQLATNVGKSVHDVTIWSWRKTNHEYEVFYVDREGDAEMKTMCEAHIKLMRPGTRGIEHR
jgi:hypothetical protein